MAKGKQTCKILKEIRKQIAAENDIELITSECTHKGDCRGTCPKCEAEVRYLERELEKRQRLGKAAIFAGMTLGTAITAASCGPLIQPTAGMPMDPDDTIIATDTMRNDSIDEPYLLEGDVLAPVPDTMKTETKKPACKSDELSAIVGDVDDDEEWDVTEGFVVPWTDDSDEPEVYMIVDEMPEFPGGDVKLMEFIAEQTKYPQEAKEKGVQGRVFVSFIVEPDGSITNKVLLRGIGGGCDEEAIRVVESMPKWKPGKLNGELVRVRYQVPIHFKLDNNQE